MKKGFTLIEILLSLSIVTILATIGIPVFLSLQNTTDLDLAENAVVQSLRRAQTLSRAVDGDTSWGVKIQNNAITLFKGASYLARDPNQDEIFDIPSSITSTNVSEIVYSKFDGLPNTTGTMTLTSNNDIRNITISSNGMLSY